MLLRVVKRSVGVTGEWMFVRGLDQCRCGTRKGQAGHISQTTSSMSRDQYGEIRFGQSAAEIGTCAAYLAATSLHFTPQIASTYQGWIERDVNELGW